MRTYQWLSGGALGIALALLLAVNIFSAEVFKGARLDLTENHVYTLSEGTRHLLQRLDEPVSLRLFLSQDLATQLPTIASYTRRVRDLLEEYRRAAGGNLRIEVIDPEPFSAAEDQAVALGLAGVPLNNGEANFYFGLAASGPTGETAEIAFFSPDRQPFVEYDITKLIHQVAWPDKRVIGLLTALEMSGDTPNHPMLSGQGGQPWIILEQMAQLFEVNTLATEIAAIPEEVDVLMLVYPHGLSTATLYAVDQFVLRGGRVLAFVDPQLADEPRPPQTGDQAAATRLLKHWGVDLDPGQVVGDLQLAEQVRFNSGQRPIVAPYPVWMTVPAQLMDQDDVVTANLGSLFFATPGHLAMAEDHPELTLTPLVYTTARANLIDGLQLGPFNNPEGLLRGFRPGEQTRNLMVRVNGTVTTAFPDGPPSAADEATTSDADDDTDTPLATPADHLATSTAPANLLIVADTDLLRDRFWVQVQNILGTRIAIPAHANGSLVVNALDNLGGDNDLISVRNRGQFERPFTKLDELRQVAELRFREKEQQLLGELRSTEQRLAELERGKGQATGSDLILSAEQERELQRFRAKQLAIRKELREVRHQLHKDIERLQAGLIFLNTALVPILIGIGGLFLALRRRSRQRTTSSKS